MTGQRYNYERFDEYVDSGQEANEFSAFPNHLHAGEAAPDFAAFRLDDGRTIRLSDVWTRRNVVLEFGSFT
jgi:hypothetical protein